MGTKIIFILYFLFFCSFTYVSSAKDNRYKEAKGYALYMCIKYISSSDSIFIGKDYSGEYFVQNTTLSPKELQEISFFVRQKYSKYKAIPLELDGNMFSYSIWSFYESKELEIFLYNLINKK
jgi:hypothetical protein